MNRKLILYTLAFLNFTNIVDSILIMPLGDIFIEEFGINAQEYSLLVSSYAIAAFISSIFGILYLDKFDRKKALVFVYSGFAIGTFLCAFANSYLMLLSLRFLTGMFGGVIGALVLSIISDIYLFKERGSAMGILMAAFSVASALGVPIGIYLAAQGSWQTPFLIIGCIGFVVSVFMIFAFPSIKTHFSSMDRKRSIVDTLNLVIKDRNQLVALAAGFFLVLGHFLIIPFISPYMIKNVGFTQMEISYQFFFGGLFTVVTSPIIGRLVDRFGVMRIYIIMLILSFFPMMIITTMGVEPLVYAITITTLFFITGTGRMIPPQTLITAAARPENRGSFMSFKSALQQLAIAMSAFISGAVVYIGEDNLFYNYYWVGILSMIICTGTILLVRKIGVAEGN